MIKHIIFDLDGVLADLTKIHAIALNMALIHYNYPEIDYHTYNGLTTNTKLNLLNIQEPDKTNIFNKKQEITFNYLDSLKPTNLTNEIKLLNQQIK